VQVTNRTFGPSTHFSQEKQWTEWTGDRSSRNVGGFHQLRDTVSRVVELFEDGLSGERRRLGSAEDSDPPTEGNGNELA
jgi:hypothetical protein